MPFSVSHRLAHRYRYLLLGGLVLTLLVQWAALLWWANNEEQQVLEANRRYMAQLAATVREQTLQLFGSTEARLRLVEFRLANDPAGDPTADPDFVRLLDKMSQPEGFHMPVRLISKTGRLDLAEPPAGGAMVDVSRQVFFTALRERSKRVLSIGQTDDGSLFGKAGIPVAWPVQLPHSRWKAVFSFIDLAALLKLHDAERIQPNGSVSLVHLDGWVLSHSPYVADVIGKPLQNNAHFRDRLSRLRQGYYISDSLLTDRMRRFVSFERVGNYPLVVTVSAGEQDVLAGLYRQRRQVFLLGGGLSLLLIGLSAGLAVSLLKMQYAAQKLENLATTDPLTGRLNRRAFFEHAEREFERGRRYQTPLVVMMLDIDFFKKVNDTYGHAIGDTVLRELSGCWFDALRRLDYIGRIGGEEFAVLLPQTTLDDAMALAERLRVATAELEIAAPQGGFHVTVSIGLTLVGPHDADFNQALERADMALYQAKQGGRNRVQVAGQHG